MNQKPFIVKDKRAFGALPSWLKQKHGANTFSYSTMKAITIGHDTKPDSDWGGKYTPLARIIILDEALFDETESICNKVLFGDEKGAKDA